MGEHAITRDDIRALADAAGVTVVVDMDGRYLIVRSWTADYIGSNKRDAATELARLTRRE